MAPPAPPSLARGVVLMTAADSAAALQASATAPSSLQLQRSSGVVTIHAGQTAVVRVVSVSTSRCETVGVSGVITQALFSAVGSCGGVGLTAIIGPASTDGSLLFALTTSSASQELVEGAFPNYTVRLDDGLYDFDFDDVVLSVTINAACPSDLIGDPLLESAAVRTGLSDALAASHPELPPGSRTEVAGLTWRRADGTYFTSLVPTAPGNTECHLDADFAAGVQNPPEPGAQPAAKFHTHPPSRESPRTGAWARREYATRSSLVTGVWFHKPHPIVTVAVVTLTGTAGPQTAFRCTS